MIGNSDDAAYALSMYLHGDTSDLLSDLGATRTVYLISGVVYKVDIGYDANRYEYEVITAPDITLPDGVYFPEVSIYRVGGENVIAMPYISGEPFARCFCHYSNDTCTSMCWTPDEERMLSSLPFDFDPDGLNAIRTPQGIYIIDAA